MDQRTKQLLGAGVGCLFLCIIASVLIGVWVASNLGDPEGVTITINQPETVTLNEPFILTLNVENSASRQQKLIDIDLTPEYLEGIYISAATPAFTDSYFSDLVGVHIYTFNLNLPANATQTIELQAVGTQVGDFRGTLEVCINSTGKCLGYPIRTVVE